jgi:putative addiction module component (TIGR02574 family)
MNLAEFGIDRLNRNEKIELAHALWDSMAASPEPLPLSDGVKAELPRRIEEDERNPGNVHTLEEVKANLAGRSRK